MSEGARVPLSEAIRCALLESASHGVSTVAIDDRGVDLFDLLERAPASHRFYWSDRRRTFEWIGVGVSEACQGIAQNEAASFGVINFRGDEARFVLPEIELTVAEDGTRLTLRSLTRQARLVLEKWAEEEKKATVLKQATSHKRVGNFQTFEQNFIQCKKLLDENVLDKVVLANAHDFGFEENVNPVSLLRYLDEHSPQTYRFMFQTSYEEAFVGASPELLFLRTGRRIESEAQAGTRPRGRNATEDSALAFELLESQKEFIEHDLVIQDIERALAGLCVDSGWIDQRQIAKLSHVQHLRSRYGGILKPGVTDADIIANLHPTAAVCGSPKDIARKWILELENFDRGLYCGAIGMMSKERTELAVGLRCALVQANNVRIFAGAGLVGGSRADNEWDEIDSKMRLYYNAVGYSRS